MPYKLAVVYRKYTDTVIPGVLGGLGQTSGEIPLI
jgi:hypothetical protein